MTQAIMEAVAVSQGLLKLKVDLIDTRPSFEVVQKLKVLVDRLDKLKRT
jgi:hypothetical protein